MRKTDQVALTQSLQMLIASNPNPADQQVLFQAVLEGIMGYIEQFENGIRQGDPKIVALRGFYQLMDEITENMSSDVKSGITCSKGCSFCCRMNVDVSRIEAQLILDFCRRKGINIDQTYLERQKDLNQQTHLFSVHSKCEFLDSKANTCKIYDVRPLACRKYFSGGDPDLCNPKKYPDGEIPVYADIDLEVVASALSTVDQSHDSMARMLLSELRPQTFSLSESLDDADDFEEDHEEDDNY